MATTQVGNASTLNVLRVQEKLISYYAERENPFAGFIGQSIESAIQRVDDLEKNRGDTVRVHLGTKLTSAGVTGDNTLEGNEEALAHYSDSLLIDQLRNAVKLDGNMTEQRSVINLRKDSGTRLGIWGREILTELMTFYASGARGVRTGHILPSNWTGHATNALNAPDSAHLLIAGAGTKAGLLATDTMTTAILDKSVRGIHLLINTSAAMRPLKVNGKPHFVALMPPEHIYDLRQSANWRTAQENANARSNENPLFSGAELAA